MKKYNYSVIRSYLDGENLLDYNIDELENDYKFMIDVIRYSGDYKMYNLASDKVKGSSKFVLFLVKNFSKNIDFLVNIVDYYLIKRINSSNDLKFEILLLMCNIIEREEKYVDKYEYYSLLCYSMYLNTRTNFEWAKLNCPKDKKIIEDLDKGFMYCKTENNDNVVVCNYFAENMIDDILAENDLDLEKVLHSTFVSKNDFLKFGRINFLISLFSLYDHYLADYIALHKESLNSILKRIETIENNWDKFVKDNELNRYNIIIEEAFSFLEKIDLFFEYSNMEIIYYIAKKLNVLDKLIKYDYCSVGDEDYILKHMTFDDKNLTMSQYLAYFNLKKIFLKYLKQKVVVDPSEEYYDDVPNNVIDLNIKGLNKKL